MRLLFVALAVWMSWSTLGGCLYYTDQLDSAPWIVLVAMIGCGVGLLGWFLEARHSLDSHNTEAAHPSWFHRLTSHGWFLVAIIASIGTFFVLKQTQITHGVRTPWSLLPIGVLFILCGLTGYGLLSIDTAHKRRAGLVGILFMLILFLGAAITYPLGYGFDPFVHEATLRHIVEAGSISPKAPVYAGYYGIVRIIEVFTPWSLREVIHLLIPEVLAWFMGVALFMKSQSTIARWACFLLPLAAFVTPTPFTMGLVLLVIAVASWESLAKRWWLVSLLILGGLMIHPLSGLPLVLLAGTELWRRIPAPNPIKQIGLVLASTVIPIALGVYGAVVYQLSPRFAPEKLSRFANDISALFFTPETTSFWLTLSHAVVIALPVITVLLVGCGVFQAYKADRALPTTDQVTLILIGSMLITLLCVDLSFVVSQEQEVFVRRILEAATICALPALQRALSSLLPRPRLSLSTRLVGAAVIALTLWGAFPRHDLYAVSRGFNRSALDEAIVATIDAQPKTDGHLVLAHQMTSVTALLTHGFSPFYGPYSIYPIPTSTPLYDLFLRMNRSPSREIAQEAANLLNTACTDTCRHPKITTVFFVVSSLWFESDRITQTALLSADASERVETRNESAVILRYDLLP